MNNYHETAAKSIEIDEDFSGLFCTIPSEMDENNRYTVRCLESAKEVVACSCTCKGFQYYRRCKHMAICQAYWNRMYKPAPKVVEAPVKKVRKSRNGLVRKVRNGGLVRVEQTVLAEKCIREAERRIEAGKVIKFPVQPAKKDMMSAALTTNKGFQLMR